MAGERAMFVIGSNFHPFTMQEQLVPFQMYKDAFEKTEDAYVDLSQKADTFKYLSETLPEDSKARHIYEGYANGLAEQAEDLAQNGLSMSNRRALTSYKRRYAGEIGRLNKADEALQEERKRRLAMSANDPSMLYANDNINIDNFLDGQSPNLYSVSGNDLYKRGLEIGASGSSRIYSSPTISKLTAMYNDAIQTQGYSPELVAKFRDNLSAIPEFQRAVEDTLKEKRVKGNLTGANYEAAKQSVINGIVNGITYKRNDSISQNPDYITAYQQQQINQAQDSLNLQAAGAGMKKDKNGKWVWDENIDPSFQKAKAVAKLKADSKTGSSTGTSHKTISKKAINIEWNGNDPSASDYDPNDVTASATDADDVSGTPVSYDDLPEFAKRQVNKYIKDGNFDYYDYYYTPYVGRGPFPDTEANVTIVPRDIVTDDADDDDFSNIFSATGK